MSFMLSELKEAPRIYEDCFKTARKTAEALAAAVKSRGINNVVTAARGTSHNAAVFFKQINELLGGFPVSHVSPYISTFYRTKQDFSKTLFVVVSQSGMSPDTLSMLETAKANGALTAAVTNNPSSPVALQADFSFDMQAGAEKAVAATKTFSGEIMCLALIAEALNSKSVLSDSIITKTTKSIQDFVSRKDEALAASPAVVVLSRGLTEAIAKECGLKIMECTYKFTFASSTNEFKHGPQALVAEGTPVILFAPDGDFKDDFVKTAELMRSRKAYLIAFTDISDVKALSDFAVDMPSCDMFEAPFVYAPVMQLFVESLTVSMGLSPDAPRNLNKVTITK